MSPFAVAASFILASVIAAAAIAVAMRGRRTLARERIHRHVLRVALGSVTDAVILVDWRGRITSMNAKAEALTAWREADALGRPLGVVFRLIDAETRASVVNPAMKALYARTVVGPSDATVLVGNDGREHAVSDCATPVCDDYGQPLGCVLVFTPAARRGPVPVRRTSR